MQLPGERKKPTYKDDAFAKTDGFSGRLLLFGLKRCHDDIYFIPP